MNEHEPQRRASFEYDPDIFETDVGPMDEGKLRAFLDRVLIPGATPAAREILKDHPGLDISRRDDGTFEVTTAFDGTFVGGFDESAFRP